VSLGTTSVTGASDLNYKYVFGPSYNYVGTAGQSFLGLDTNIGGPGSASDRLIVSGTAAGKTAINLWDTSAGPGTLNLTGITLAAVNGASSNAFFLNGQTNPAHQVVGSPQFDEYEPAVGPMGAIKKGLFFYPLLQDTPGFVAQGGSGAGSRYALFGLPDIEAFPARHPDHGCSEHLGPDGVGVARPAGLCAQLDAAKRAGDQRRGECWRRRG